MFAVEKLEAVRNTGKVFFFKLVRDNLCLFDDFYEEQKKDVKRLEKIAKEVKDEIMELIKEKIDEL